MGDADAASDLDTLTLARVYLDQGRVDEAAAIYERLIGSACGDTHRIVELRAVVERSLAGAADARRRAAELPAELPRGYGLDSVVVVPLGPGRVLCVWEVTPRGVAAAARLAGPHGALALRLITAIPGDAPGGGAGRATRDVPVARDVGEAVAEAPRAGGFLAAAIGLLAADGRFAPIAHSEVLPLAAAPPAAAGAPPVLLEVEPARGGLDHEPPEPREVAP